jgi:hypothetical protein
MDPLCVWHEREATFANSFERVVAKPEKWRSAQMAHLGIPDIGTSRHSVEMLSCFGKIKE